MPKCCRNCGNVIKYTRYANGKPTKFECANGKKVDPNGVCDRWQIKATADQIGQRMDKISDLIDRMKPDEEYVLTKRAAYMENYRIVGDEK